MAQQFGPRTVRLGVAPIAWTNADIPELGGDTPVQTCLRESREAGYSATEISSNFPDRAADLEALLQEVDLVLASGWHSGHLVDGSLDDAKANIDREIAYYQACGTDIMFYGELDRAIQSVKRPLSTKPVLSDSELVAYCERMSALAEHCRDQGMRLAYHPHMGAVIQTEAEVDALMAGTSDALGLLVDSGHLMFAGGDACAVARRHSSRVQYVHFKDIRRELMEQSLREDWDFMRGVVEGVFTVPGDGCIDFGAFIGALAEIGYSGWTVVEAEQNPARANPKQYSVMGREHVEPLLTKHGFTVLPPGRGG